MKGPGLRIDVDVRRAWRCPVCGQNQRLTMDITAPRCLCVRDGVPMKLAEGLRPGRLSLRTDLRSMLDRIQGGEEFPRLTSPLTSDSDAGPRDGGSGSYGGAKSRSRPPRPERTGDRNDGPPREPRPQDMPSTATAEPVRPAAPSPSAAVPSPQPLITRENEDDFGAGIGAVETPTP